MTTPTAINHMLRRKLPLAFAVQYLLVLPAIAAAADGGAQQPAPVVVVSGSKMQHSSFDLAASVDVIDAAQIQDAQLRVNVSESLNSVPGIVVQNRQNYAQDLQISSRGFGARPAFGVRGVHLLTDGIPATMPDGQGQAATFNLDMAERIEVLRGPFSALYGNHSGGVIQLFTRDPSGDAVVGVTTAAGSDGIRKTDVNAEGTAGPVGFLLDASHFETAGYRRHSAAERDQAYAKLVTRPDKDSRLTLIANSLHQPDTQDPLGTTWATFQRDPRACETDPADTQSPQRCFAERYNTRKSIGHTQAGLAYERRFGLDSLHLTLYGGNRKVTQFQAFSKGFQSSPSSSGGVVDFDRDFNGLDLNWQDTRTLDGATLRTTIGVEYGSSRDRRAGYENFAGTQFGVIGNLRRDETDDLRTLDPYLQSEWQRGRWILTAGLRHTRLDVDVRDRFLSNGDDSGRVSYARTTPLLSALYKVAPQLNVYTSAARGFETPTLNELFYSGAGGGFNFRLRPSTSMNVEAGVKALLPDHLRIDAAVFQVRTHDELAVDSSTGGRTSYRNAGRTLRQGMELSLHAGEDSGWNGQLAATLLRAVYDEGFGNVPAGARLPGVPNASLFASAGWKDDSGLLDAAIETFASARAYPDDANAAHPAPGYTTVSARLHSRQQYGAWSIKEFARLNNLFDRSFAGSVIVGDSNQRYYEPAPRRNWVMGLSAQYRFR
ncbi:TonB-dependent receptor [Massilia terrae]|uniref:TonB-dependent receptor n=1 Tax=Massilia terrae TaxID=1811224 RepID=A0ABT2D4Q1_9BURK|nr:TonB-dependent receptor [Massilia terrae]MCS0661229.1 TonB-dependent receptor [Massilia terrae]